MCRNARVELSKYEGLCSFLLSTSSRPRHVVHLAQTAPGSFLAAERSPAASASLAYESSRATKTPTCASAKQSWHSKSTRKSCSGPGFTKLLRNSALLENKIEQEVVLLVAGRVLVRSSPKDRPSLDRPRSASIGNSNLHSPLGTRKCNSQFKLSLTRRCCSSSASGAS